MNQIIYRDFQGSGYVTEGDNLKFYEEIETTIAGILLMPGIDTTMNNYFIRPLKYLGIAGHNELVFFLKKEIDLFSEKYYYLSVFKITETRIFEMFGDQFGSDHNFINGVWK